MSDINELMAEVTRNLTMTKEYNQYRNLLERLKAQPDLYRRVGEFRRRSIQIQMQMENSENAIHGNNELNNEFLDLQNNGLANDFFVAERQYCRIIRELQDCLMEGAQVETSFLEE